MPEVTREVLRKEVTKLQLQPGFDTLSLKNMRAKIGQSLGLLDDEMMRPFKDTIKELVIEALMAPSPSPAATTAAAVAGSVTAPVPPSATNLVSRAATRAVSNISRVSPPLSPALLPRHLLDSSAEPGTMKRADGPCGAAPGASPKRPKPTPLGEAGVNVGVDPDQNSAAAAAANTKLRPIAPLESCGDHLQSKTARHMQLKVCLMGEEHMADPVGRVVIVAGRSSVFHLIKTVLWAFGLNPPGTFRTDDNQGKLGIDPKVGVMMSETLKDKGDTRRIGGLKYKEVPGRTTIKLDSSQALKKIKVAQVLDTCMADYTVNRGEKVAPTVVGTGLAGRATFQFAVKSTAVKVDPSAGAGQKNNGW